MKMNEIIKETIKDMEDFTINLNGPFKKEFVKALLEKVFITGKIEGGRELAEKITK